MGLSLPLSVSLPLSLSLSLHTSLLLRASVSRSHSVRGLLPFDSLSASMPLPAFPFQLHQQVTPRTCRCLCVFRMTRSNTSPAAAGLPDQGLATAPSHRPLLHLHYRGCVDHVCACVWTVCVCVCVGGVRVSLHVCCVEFVGNSGYFRRPCYGETHLSVKLRGRNGGVVCVLVCELVRGAFRLLMSIIAGVQNSVTYPVQPSVPTHARIHSA